MPLSSEGRFDFRGGVSRLRRQNKNEMYYCQNARPSADGALVVRNGQVQSVNIASTGNMEAIYARYTQTLGLRIYSIRRSDGVNDACYVDGTQISGDSFGARDYSSILAYKGVIFFSNGSSAINYHQPTENSSYNWGARVWGADSWGVINTRAVVSGDPEPPIGSYMIIYKERMYIGKDNGTLYWSNAGLFTTLPTVDFPALNFQPIGGEGDPITGLAVGENLLIAFTAGTYQLMTGVPEDDGGVGDMNWQIYGNVGCSTGRSIATSGSKVAFLGTDRRMYILEGTILTDIDKKDKVREYLTAPSSTTLRTIAATFYGKELWIRLPSGNSETVGRTLVYDTSSKVWTVFTKIDGFAFHVSPSVGKFFVGKVTSSTIYSQDVGLFDPSAAKVPFEFLSRQEVFGTFRKRKSFKNLNLQLDVNQGESLAVTYSTENNDAFTAFGDGSPIAPTGKVWGAEAWGASPWGGISRQNQFLRPVSGGVGVQATEMRIKITGDVSPGTRLLGYELDAEVLPRDEEVI